MKYSKVIKINLPNYQNVTVGVDECSSFSEANEVLKKEVLTNKYPIDKFVAKALDIKENEVKNNGIC